MIFVKVDATEALRAIDGLPAAGLAVIRNIEGRMVKEVYRRAFDKLSGARFAPKVKGKRLQRSATGAYPVPVRTGHLRRSLAMLFPGQSKAGLSAGLDEAIVYNPAAYAWAIHQGREDMGTEGRPFLSDAVKDTLGLLDGIAQNELDRGIK